MNNICPIKDSRWVELDNIARDRAMIAYKGNGNNYMDKAPNSRSSKLFKDIVAATGSKESAIFMKTQTFTKAFIEQTKGLSKDENGEFLYEEIKDMLFNKPYELSDSQRGIVRSRFLNRELILPSSNRTHFNDDGESTKSALISMGFAEDSLVKGASRDPRFKSSYVVSRFAAQKEAIAAEYNKFELIKEDVYLANRIRSLMLRDGINNLEELKERYGVTSLDGFKEALWPLSEPHAKTSDALLDEIDRMNSVLKQVGAEHKMKDDLPSSTKTTVRGFNPAKELPRFAKMLPNVPVKLHNELLDGNVEGTYHKGLVEVCMGGLSGVSYHEGFHAVMDMYLNPEEKSSILEEAGERYGAYKSSRQLEENLAEEFREYAEHYFVTDSPMINKLFAMLKDLRNLFKKKSVQNVIFRKIVAGRYNYVTDPKSEEKMYSRLNLEAPLINDTLDNLTYRFFSNIGVLDSGAVLGKDKKDAIQNSINQIFNDYKKEALASEADIKSNYVKVLKNWDTIIEAFKIRLQKYDINLNTIAEVEGEENKEDAFIEEGIKEFGFAASVTQSVKKGSTQEVRLMLATLPDVEKHSRYFGEKFKTLAPTELVWKKLEDALVGLGEDQISDSGVTTMEQRMIDAVREAGEAYPPLKVLADRLSSPNMPPHKKIGFFSTFSKARNNYRTALFAEEEDGWAVKIIDSDSQKASSLLITEWKKDFFNNLPTNESLKVAVSNMRLLTIEARKAIVAKQNPPKNSVNIIIDSLHRIGVPVSAQGVMKYIHSQKGNGNLQLMNAISELSNIFVHSKYGKSVESFMYEVTPEGKLTNTYASRTMLNEDTKTYITDNRRILSELAEAESYFNREAAENSVLGADGKVYYTASLNNHMTKQLTNWQLNPHLIGEHFNKLFHRGSNLAEYFQSHIENVKITIGLNSKVENTDDKGRENTELETGDELIQKMNEVLQGALYNNNATYSLLTFADKPIKYQLSGMPLESFGTGNAPITKDSHAVDYFYKYAFAEMERIVAVKNGNLEISSYSDGKNLGMQAHFFKKLSYGSDFAKEIGLYEGDRLNLTEENKDAIKTYIATSLTDTIKSEFEYHKRKKVIGAKNVIVGLDKNIIRKYGAGDVKGFRNMFTDYILNQIAISIETTMVFTGDPAFYKDLSKRVIEIIATGKDLVGVDKNYNISVIKDTIVNLADKDGKEDERYTSWKNTLADAIYKRKNNSDLKLSISKDAAMKEAINILNPYTKVNQADGLGYITPERFKQVVSGLGLWVSELHDPIFEILNNPNSNPAWLSENINTFNFPTGQSLKGQHFELINSKMGDEDILLPIYLKYSQAVLWPTVVKGTHLEDLLHKMRAEGIDEVINESAIKAGAHAIGTFDKLGGKITLSNSHYRLQQDSTAKFFKTEEVTKGTQPVKNIMANINDNDIYIFNGEEISGRDLIAKMHEIETKLSDMGREKIESLFGVGESGGIKDLSKLKNSILNQFIADGVSENIWRPLLESKDIHLDSLVQGIDKIEQTIYSKIKKTTVTMKINGGSFVQVSNLGMGFKSVKSLEALRVKSKNQLILLSDESELRGPHFDEKLGKVVPGTVFLPSTVLDKIPGIREMMKEKDFTSAKLKKMLGDSLSLIGYRIPNQNFTSIDDLQIGGILPAFMGDSMVTFTEISAKTGSDFDIDKMFTMMYNVEWNETTQRLEKVVGDSKEGLENQRIDAWKAVLTSLNNFDQVITPLDADWLKDDAKYIDFLSKIGDELSANNPRKEREYTPENITKLEANEVFVFGANTVGGHGGGTAGLAQRGVATPNYSSLPIGTKGKWSEYGIVDKLMQGTEGKSFGIVTKAASISGNSLKIGGRRSVPLNRIEESINKLIATAIANPNLKFLVTKFGTNMAGFSEQEMKSLLSGKQLPDNIILPKEFEVRNVTSEQIGEKNDSQILKDLGYSNLHEFLNSPERFSKVKEYLKKSTGDVSDLGFYKVSTQQEIKEQNLVGKAGIGQTANHNSHIPLAQQAKLKFNIKLLNKGVIVNGKSVLYSEVNENGDLISQVVSAWLNGYVDNAKDPYLSLINNNTKTAPTVFMLLRAGVDPHWVNLFIRQPIIKKYVENLNYKNRKLKDVTFESFNTMQVSDKGAVYFTKKTNGIMDPIAMTLRDFWIDSAVSTIDERVFENPESLERQIVYPNENQFEIFKKFLQLQKYAKELNDVVSACKYDTKGAGMDSAENLSMKLKKDSFKDLNFIDIASANRLFEGTMLEAFYKNSSELAFDILSDKLITNSPKALATLDFFVNNFNKSFDTSAIRDIFKGFRSYVLSGYSDFELTAGKLHPMFYGDNTIANRILEAKKILKLKYADTKLILFDDFVIDIAKDMPKFATIPSAKKRDEVANKQMWERWEELILGTHEDSEIKLEKGTIQDLMKDLVAYSFYTSGFNKNMSSFYDLIPYTYLHKEGVNLNSYINDQFTDVQLMDMVPDKGFIDQYIRHNYLDDNLVPKVKASELSKIGVHVYESLNTGVYISKMQFPSALNTGEDNSIEPVKYMKIKTDGGFRVFRYAGAINDVHFYEPVSKLGYDNKGKKVYEYAKSRRAQSIFEQPVAGLPSSLKDRLSLEAKPYTNNFGDVTVDKTNIAFKNLENVVFRLDKVKDGYIYRAIVKSALGEVVKPIEGTVATANAELAKRNLFATLVSKNFSTFEQYLNSQC